MLRNNIQSTANWIQSSSVRKIFKRFFSQLALKPRANWLQSSPKSCGELKGKLNTVFALSSSLLGSTCVHHVPSISTSSLSLSIFTICEPQNLCASHAPHKVKNLLHQSYAQPPLYLRTSYKSRHYASHAPTSPRSPASYALTKVKNLPLPLPRHLPSLNNIADKYTNKILEELKYKIER